MYTTPTNIQNCDVIFENDTFSYDDSVVEIIINVTLK